MNCLISFWILNQNSMDMKNKLGTRGLQSEGNRPNLVIKGENSRKYILKNPNLKVLLHYRIDNGLITSGETKKCDDGIGIPELNRFYLIEFKGHHLRDAAKQFMDTLDFLEPKLRPCRFEARVILSRVSSPDLDDSNIIALRKRLAKFHGKLRPASKILEESLE